MSRLTEMQALSLERRIKKLKGIAIDLKAGRGYTSGKSGVVAYTIGDNGWDEMFIEKDGVEYVSNVLELENTGSMSSGNSMVIVTKYDSLYQDFPIISPFLRINVNGVDLAYAGDGGYPPWRASDGSTWSVGVDVYLRESQSYLSTPKHKEWVTYLSYFGTADLDIKMDMQIKSTDKGSVTTEVSVTTVY